jgi:hypothetical protein
MLPLPESEAAETAASLEVESEDEDRRVIAPPFSSPVHAADVSACMTWVLRLPTELKILAYLADIDLLSM